MQQRHSNHPTPTMATTQRDAKMATTTTTKTTATRMVTTKSTTTHCSVRRNHSSWMMMLLGFVNVLRLLFGTTTDVLVSATADYSRPDDTLSTVAFGSCHKRRAALRRSNGDGGAPSIWKVIQTMDQPDAWLWTGDAVYPSIKDIIDDLRRSEQHPNVTSSSTTTTTTQFSKEAGKGQRRRQRRYYSWKKYGPASTSILRKEYQSLLTSDTLGYNKFHPPMGIYGTWDDHDFGGNDLGREMPDREERQDAFFDFLGLTPPSSSNHDDENDDDATQTQETPPRRRNGVYNSVEWGHAPTKVKSIHLDTRYNRDNHCIPGVAHRVPLGAGVACATRWLTAGLHLAHLAWLWGKPDCASAQILGEEQWAWFEKELFENDSGDTSTTTTKAEDENEDAQVYIIVSSIQVLTTNPAMESWGHFPNEQRRLVELLNRRSSSPYHKSTGHRPVVLLLSGDVHHAEFSGRGTLLEVTSSGLTHDCEESALYGKLCRPLLETFDSHRYNGNTSSFYIGLNYGIIHMDWDKGHVVVHVKDSTGAVVLTSPILPIGSTAEGNNNNSDDGYGNKYIPPPYESLPLTWDGHLIPLVQLLILTMAMAVGIIRIIRTFLSGEP
jgi:alkaline phosphatase D